MATYVQQIIVLGKGDRGRLEYILELLTKGKTLPLSDQKYLESIIPLYLGTQDTESLQKHAEHAINMLHGEIRTLDERLAKIERKGFQRYIGKKAMLFFATVFVGWHVFQNSITYALGQYVPSGIEQYLFPLNILANNFNSGSLVWMIFIFIVLSWPFIGAAHMIKFIRSRKTGKILS
ncbi:MAG: hypothetical protein ACREBB_08285 [Nitrosotalea sp.]